jgi:hypothetical protein
MTASAGYDPRRSTGYRIEQLAGAFDRIRDPADWHAPVWAVIVADERPLGRDREAGGHEHLQV